MDLLGSALKLATLAEREAKRINAAMTFCAIDIHGNIILKHRMNGANLISIEMSERKAYAVAAIGMDTAEMSALAKPGMQFHLLVSASADKYWIDGGGVRLIVDGQFVGGFGVSGGTTEQDVVVANAAAQAFATS